MLSWLGSRWKRWRGGYRVEGMPTSDEMAARCREVEALASRLLIERDRLQKQVAELRDAAVGDRIYPGLTPGQVERLALLAEECGEVIQAVGKVLRHGYDGQNPYRREPLTNRVGLERELGDLHAVLGLLYGAGELRGQEVHTWKRKKQGRIGKWLHHQGLPTEAKQAWGFSENLEVLPVERKTEAQPAQ